VLGLEQKWHLGLRLSRWQMMAPPLPGNFTMSQGISKFV